MIPLYQQILLAILLDLLLGDPRWLPHPVQGIGWLAQTCEAPLRRLIGNQKIAGIVAVFWVVGGTVAAGFGLLKGASLLHPLAGDLVAILLLYTCFATRSLHDHALAVYRPLMAGDLVAARQRVGWLVGRDTDQLDEGEVTRAAVESVAENTVDGCTAPLLFACLAGPLGALAYKAISTLDSTFGYKNERYLLFGWGSARLDDLANLIPARLTALLVVPAALVLRLDAGNAWRIFWRDRHNHPSPNGGQIESAVAGALGVQLGGVNSYFGQPSSRPFMGEPLQSLAARHILQAVQLMWLVYGLVALIGVGCRLLINSMC
ncbi:MAG: adenosylcobinamide-phosphate synthase CbiB [Trichlorobacter sp.]|uniref:adenosylcobinamide-phosphate synthase CbiB n=1 Tax=Trichlorobacter sp. TaxID=2911007 RepID=UPI00255FC83E|nr:adenosylcobinamide-phosphate synthase CbiB [Trichlorobacter sp.]MDK9716695.1 adenosylcobinamide-phosphate synthase CbiB [Trichlorobacter sp.]